MGAVILFSAVLLIGSTYFHSNSTLVVYNSHNSINKQLMWIVIVKINCREDNVYALPFKSRSFSHCTTILLLHAQDVGFSPK